MQLASCVRAQFLRRERRLTAQLRRYQATAAYVSSHTAQPAGEPQAKPSVTKPQRQSRLQQQEATAWPGVDFSSLHSQSPSVRVRQHVNPFTPTLQIPVPPLDWNSIYADACRPLAIDIGCGPGRFPLALAAHMPAYNVLGIDIRAKLLERATAWTELVGCQDRIHFHTANATVSLHSMLSSYPGPIKLFTVQFPDPHWKLRNRKRRIVQPQLVAAVAHLIAPEGQVLLQSDVQEVVASMRDAFEFHGQGAFAPAQAHSQQDAVFLTDQMTVEPLPKDSLQRQAWRSSWQDAGWLQHNPLGVPTEREVHTLENKAPVYRVLLSSLKNS
ncbi:hypothetical protein ABBQ32_011442 [Trebouxia sp. C0010 RCD-2024]